MNLIPKDTDYVIPPLKKEGEKRSKSAIEVNQQPLLYDLTSMDQETNRFDFLKEPKIV